ncbi:MAG TPA: ABC transporter ATP-binding protein [Nevskiaceae bacterium]|nr:ABC transporter ATP-binding protein [Nevskiaceae bacterium]
MIRVENLRKSYRRPDGSRLVVYDNLNLELPARTNVGIMGRNGAGKSTLIRLLSGVDRPEAGRVIVEGRISPPIGDKGGVSNWLSGRENAKFVARVCGLEGDALRERVEFIKTFSELGEFFEQPVKTYSSGMRQRLGFSISMAFDYDYYLLDEATSAGDHRFRKRANQAFRTKRNRASIILVSHSVNALREWCDVGLYIKDHQVHYFDDVDDAVDAYMRDNDL